MSAHHRGTPWARRMRQGLRYAEDVRSVRTHGSRWVERWTLGYTAILLTAALSTPLAQAVAELISITLAAAVPVIGERNASRLLLGMGCAGAVFAGVTLGPVQTLTQSSRFRLTLPVARERVLAPSLAVCTALAVLAAGIGTILIQVSGSHVAARPAEMVIQWMLVAALMISLAAVAQALSGRSLAALCLGVGALVATGLPGRLLFSEPPLWVRGVLLLGMLAVNGWVLHRIRTETVLDTSRRSRLAYASLYTQDSEVTRAALTLPPQGLRPNRWAGRSVWGRVLVGLGRTAPSVIAGLFAASASALIIPTLRPGTWPQVVYGLVMVFGTAPLFGPAQQEKALHAQGVLRRGGFWEAPHLVIGTGLLIAALAPALLLMPPSPSLWVTAAVCLLLRLARLAGGGHRGGPRLAPVGDSSGRGIRTSQPGLRQAAGLAVAGALLWAAHQALLHYGP